MYKDYFWHPENLNYEFVYKGIDSIVNLVVKESEIWNNLAIEEVLEFERKNKCYLCRGFGYSL